MSELEKNTLETEIETSKEVSEVVEKIEKWNVGKISELIEWIKKKFNIQETAVVQSATNAPESEKPEEKGGNVSVKIVKIEEKPGLNKIVVYGVVKDLINELQGESINIIHAKKRMEEGDKIILKNIPQEEATKAQKKLSENGITVEIK